MRKCFVLGIISVPDFSVVQILAEIKIMRASKLFWKNQTMLSSVRKSVIPIFRIPYSSYQRFFMSPRTMIFENESPVNEKGISSDLTFSSDESAKAD